jgi:hypothetical protein
MCGMRCVHYAARLGERENNNFSKNKAKQGFALSPEIMWFPHKDRGEI